MNTPIELAYNRLHARRLANEMSREALAELLCMAWMQHLTSQPSILSGHLFRTEEPLRWLIGNGLMSWERRDRGDDLMRTSRVTPIGWGVLLMRCETDLRIAGRIPEPTFEEPD